MVASFPIVVIPSLYNNYLYNIEQVSKTIPEIVVLPIRQSYFKLSHWLLTIYILLAGIELKRKWSNCRDYYKKDTQKLKSISTGSAAKKGKRYVYADILCFLDKVVKRRNHEGNYEADDNDEQSVTDAEDEHEEQRDVRIRIALGNIKTENIHKNNNSDEESEPKKKKTQDATKNYDDDEKYLLSFSSDMKKMTHLQKIDFKLGMMLLLKNIFKENANNSSP